MLGPARRALRRTGARRPVAGVRGRSGRRLDPLRRHRHGRRPATTPDSPPAPPATSPRRRRPPTAPRVVRRRRASPPASRSPTRASASSRPSGATRRRRPATTTAALTAASTVDDPAALALALEGRASVLVDPADAACCSAPPTGCGPRSARRSRPTAPTSPPSPTPPVRRWATYVRDGVRRGGDARSADRPGPWSTVDHAVRSSSGSPASAS